MRPLTNQNATSLEEAVALAQQAIQQGRSVSFAGGGTDLLQLMKDRIVNRPGSETSDVLVNLKTIEGLDQIDSSGEGLNIGGLTTLDTVIGDPMIRERYTAIGEAAESVGSPQIRNAGTVAGNVVQRPWCWYYRNGFDCYKAGGTGGCYSIGGENQLHAILGGGPSYIVHPSDVAPTLVAFGAQFRVVGPSGERSVPASDFFVLPSDDVEHENVLADNEILASIDLPAPPADVRSTYRKIMDRDTWTHAISSVCVGLRMDGDVCRGARIVLGGVAPIPWRVEAAEQLLVDQRVTPELAGRVGAAAVAGARPLLKNAYKVPLTQKLVGRTVLELAESA